MSTRSPRPLNYDLPKGTDLGNSDDLEGCLPEDRLNYILSEEEVSDEVREALDRPSKDQNQSTRIRIQKRNHFLRTLIPIGIALLIGYMMAIEQVLIDNDSLRYFYNVNSQEEWQQFHDSMVLIRSNSTLNNDFPSVIISNYFGGSGIQGNIERSTLQSIPSRSALLIDDFLFRRNSLRIENGKAIADVVCSFYFVLTILFLLVLPYVDAFKTNVRKKIVKMKGIANASARHLTAVFTPTGQSPSSESPEIPILGEETQESSYNVSNAEDSYKSKLEADSLGQSLFFFPYRWIHGLVFVRRLVMILAINYGLRAMIVWMTVFPQENFECIPTFSTNPFQSSWLAFQMLLGTKQSCHDFMFSGHTSLTVINLWFWVVYSANVLLHPRKFFMDVEEESDFYEEFTPSSVPIETEVDAVFSMERSPTLTRQKSRCRIASYQLPRKRSKISIIVLWAIRCTSSIFLVLIATLLLLSRIHYTVDVGVGLIIGTLLFWFYHALLSLFYYFVFKKPMIDDDDVILKSGLSRQDAYTRQVNREIRDILVPLKSINLFLRFLGYIDGYDLYEADHIGYSKPMQPLSQLVVQI